jgi:hypothetical protein
MYKRILPPILLFLVFFAGMSVVQFSTPNLPDNDGFYHIKLAWLMRTEGLKPDFPWLPLSILNEREYYDHHFLFHVALIPFTFGDLLAGAKWAAVTFSALAFMAVWYLFHRQRIPFAWLWAAALLGVSDAFLYRMSITRAQSLSLGVLALGLTWMLEGKYKPLAVLSFFYVWMYNAFPLMLALAGLQVAAAFILERRLDFRPVIWVGAGLLAGLIINPYFPNNLIFTYHHYLPKLIDMESIRVGNEWYPYDTGQLLDNSLPALVAFASGIFALGLSGRKMELRTLMALLLTLFFCLMLFKARRFVEYFPPFALIFAAFAFAPLLEQKEEVDVPHWLTYFPQSLLILAVIAGTMISIPAAQGQISKSKPANLYEGASDWLEANTPMEALIFQTDWDDFPRLLFYNTHNTYLAGLDPTYFQIYDADLYNEWVAITRGDVEMPSEVIRSQFSARYIHTDLEHDDFIRQAEDDPGLREVYRDEQAVIYEVLER